MRFSQFYTALKLIRSDDIFHVLYTIDLNYIVIVKTMKSTSIVTDWVSSIILLLALVTITVPLAHAQMTLNITRADADKPYGGEKLGTVLIVPKELHEESVKGFS